MESEMKKSTWKITTFSDGDPVASAEGLSHLEAVVAIRRAMYGSDPLTEDFGQDGNAPAVELGRRIRTDAPPAPVAA